MKLLCCWTALVLGSCSPPDSVATESESSASLTETEPGSDTEAPLPENCSTPNFALSPGGEFVPVGSNMAFVYFQEDSEATERPCRPLLAFLHGGDNPGGFVAGEWRSPLETALVDLARTENLVLFVPFLENAGQVEHTWEDEDVAVVAAMIQAAADQVSIDTDAILVVGHAEGGEVATRVALEHDTAVTAAAAVAAGLAEDASYPDPAPVTRHPFFVAHDPSDDVVPVSASESLVDWLDDHGHPVESQLDWDLDGHGWSRELDAALVAWWLGE